MSRLDKTIAYVFGGPGFMGAAYAGYLTLKRYRNPKLHTLDWLPGKQFSLTFQLCGNGCLGFMYGMSWPVSLPFTYLHLQPIK